MSVGERVYSGALALILTGLVVMITSCMDLSAGTSPSVVTIATTTTNTTALAGTSQATGTTEAASTDTEAGAEADAEPDVEEPATDSGLLLPEVHPFPTTTDRAPTTWYITYADHGKTYEVLVDDRLVITLPAEIAPGVRLDLEDVPDRAVLATNRAYFPNESLFLFDFQAVGPGETPAYVDYRHGDGTLHSTWWIEVKVAD